MFFKFASVSEIVLISSPPSPRIVADWTTSSVASLKIIFNCYSFPGGILNKIAIVSLAEWKQSFLGKCVYRLQFGNSNNGIIQTNQLSIPWRPEEVTVELFGLNIQGAGAVPIDYKVAYLSEQGGLYVYCSTPGASGVNLLPWQVVDATILIQRK